ncbi:unnamed protein product [Clavelina lepadiformis]|uniref:Uncharacterized protein n=1 Tax=Clavelina lepadiformis TaxID=159417 RepID=A0ABP0FD18_CLALP
MKVFVLAQNGVPKPLVCYQGYNAFSADKSTFYEGNLTAQLCKPDQNCGFTTHLNTSDPLYPAFASLTQFTWEPDSVLKKLHRTPLTVRKRPCGYDCKIDFCNSSTCNENLVTPIPPSCSSSSDDRAWMACLVVLALTLVDTLTRIKASAGRKEQFVDVSIGKVQGCLAEGCPTVLDAIPDVTQSYETVICIASRIQSLESGLRMLLGGEGLTELIYSLLCRSPDTTFVPPDLQNRLSVLEQLDSGDFYNPVCDQDVLPDLIKYAPEALRRLGQLDNSSCLMRLIRASRKLYKNIPRAGKSSAKPPSHCLHRWQRGNEWRVGLPVPVPTIISSCERPCSFDHNQNSSSSDSKEKEMVNTSLFSFMPSTTSRKKRKIASGLTKENDQSDQVEKCFAAERESMDCDVLVW